MYRISPLLQFPKTGIFSLRRPLSLRQREDIVPDRWIGAVAGAVEKHEQA